MRDARRPDLTATATVLLAGGRGSRLHELTSRECKPALPFAGPRRIVDFTLANAVRSGLGRMIVATQYRPETLARHLKTHWAGQFAPGALRLREGTAVTGTPQGYGGTAAAVAANLDELQAEGVRELVVLAADHVYAMDYAGMVAAHRASGASATVAVDTVPRHRASAFGVVRTSESGRIESFLEKPDPVPADPALPGRAQVSMGIYVFDLDWLASVLRIIPGTAQDFGNDILPLAVALGEANAYRVPDEGFYWRDVGTLDAYRLAQLEFQRGEPPCALPPRIGASEHEMRAASGELIQFAFRMQTGGMSLHAPRLGADTPGRWTMLDESVLLPGARVAPGVRLTRTIVAPGTSVPAGLVIGEDADEDARWFRRTEEGTVLVTTQMLARRAADRGRPVAPFADSRMGRSA
ncbi:NTP transferase domain-containing protein [Cereibacter azotoformans]|uniref:Glucose-1-phosphate adenylyltransferase n=1 Tax=Cereibacter sphaeroides (strain ATCC 17025 / ATH 2.4.3) TaxID=349102 RepID=A4WUU2_CERS5|nr:sugar phosphate nucleotidyltransferase [Cereibacter azotoformans]ULB10368.1 NTP transferase domain-containing protein [Cereibacter azotoformans]